MSSRSSDGTGVEVQLKKVQAGTQAQVMVDGQIWNVSAIGGTERGALFTLVRNLVLQHLRLQSLRGDEVALEAIPSDLLREYQEVRDMVQRNHVPTEFWDVRGNLEGVTCVMCSQSWPCMTQVRLADGAVPLP